MSRLGEFRESVLDLGYYFVKSRVLHTALELDIFERLGSASKTAATLAEEIGAHRESLELFLNALVSLGLLASDGRAYCNMKYGSEILLKGKPFYIGDIVGLQNRSAHDWMKLKECVLNGKPIDEPDFFKVDDESATEGFARAMHNTAMGHADHLARKLTLRSCKTLLDVGGGPGTFTVHFLKANPELRATIFDLPTTLKTTRTFIEAAKLTDRVAYQEGDFNRDEFRGTFDVCFLSHIIHGQGIETNQKLFQKIFAHLNTGGRLFVQDFFLDQGRQSPQFSALFALNMLVHTQSGRTYTFSEVERWMTEAGFVSVKPLTMKLPRSIAIVVGEKHS